MRFCDIPLKSFSENFKQLTKIKINNASIHFAFFSKTIGFCNISFPDMNTARKASLISNLL